jgi:photosystem II stability/assembly factor-like uncharacterized protein
MSIDSNVTSGNIVKITFSPDKIIGLAIVLLNNNSSVILRTSDNGNSWTIAYQAAGYLNSISFLSNTKILAAADIGEMYLSESGGQSWNFINTNIFNDITDIDCSDNLNCFTCGNNGWIHKTIDGSSNWNSAYSGTAINFTSVFSVNSDSIFTVGYTASDSAFLVNTYNGGSIWFPPLYMGVKHLNDVFFADRFTGYTVGGSPVTGSNSQYIAKTIDGGFTWVQQFEATQKELNAVYFVNALNGYAVGDNGTVIKTTNGGVTGIAEKHIDKNLSFFPNPVNDFVEVKLESKKSFSYRIIDLNGKEILIGENKNAESKINCNSLQKGNYVLIVEQEGKVFSGQFLKQ